MRDLALRLFAPIVLCTAMTLLLSASAATQTAPPASAAEPATAQESQHSASSVSNDVPAALVEVLRKEKVAITFLESPRLDPQARASLMRSLKQHLPSAHVVRGTEEADVVVAIGVFLEGLPGTQHSDVVVPEEGDQKKAAARKPFQVLVFRRAAPTETVVLYESASVARGGVSQRTGLDKRRAALDLAMKNLGVIAATEPAEKK